MLLVEAIGEPRLPSIPGGHMDISHFIPVVFPGEAVGFHTGEEGSERVRHCRRSHSTARGGGLQTTGLLTFLKALAILQAGGQRGSPGWRAESLLLPSTCPWEDALFLFNWPQGGTQGAQLCSRGGGPSSCFHCPRCHGSRKAPCVGGTARGGVGPQSGEQDADKGDR